MTSLPFDQMTLINLCISSYREATGATFIHSKAKVVMDVLFQIFCDNEIQQILQERQNALVVADLLEALVFVHETS